MACSEHYSEPKLQMVAIVTMPVAKIHSYLGQFRNTDCLFKVEGGRSINKETFSFHRSQKITIDCIVLLQLMKKLMKNTLDKKFSVTAPMKTKE